MIADNWAICPRCLKKAKGQEEEMWEYMDEIKNTMPTPLLERLMETKPFNVEGLRTLQEDYEIWINDKGVLKIAYTAHCSTCKFRHEYKAESQAEV